MPKVSLILLIVFFAACKLTSSNKEPLFKKDLSNEAERKNTLFVFVGEKISAEMQPHDSGSMDGRMIARYKILQRVYGDHKSDTIEFTAYDHYGTPMFSHFKNALLFVSEYEGNYYHEKYQYYDVYKTKDGRWAGTGFVTGCKEGDKPVEFAEPVSYHWIWRDECGHSDTFKFDRSCFRLEGEKVIPATGHYVEELFNIQKKTALRSYFEKANDENGFDVKDSELAQVKDDEPEYIGQDSIEVLKVFDKFIAAVNRKNMQELKNVTLDTIICQPCASRLYPPPCNTPPLLKISIQDFVNKEFDSLESRNFSLPDKKGMNQKMKVAFVESTVLGGQLYYNPSSKHDLLVYLVNSKKVKEILFNRRYSYVFTKQNGMFKLRGIYVPW